MSTHTNSASYLRRLKNLVESIKSLHPLVKRIPAPLPRPGTPAFGPSKDAAAKDITARQEAFQKADNLRLDKSVAPYFLQAATIDDTRRQRA
jgi:hypothetical protein